MLTVRASKSEIKEIQELLKEIKPRNRKTNAELIIMALKRLRGSYKNKTKE